MNGFPTHRELPVLNDDQIRLIDSICKAASRSTDAPFKALTREYHKHYEERGLDTSHDDVILRWYSRIGDAARRSHRHGRPTNLVPYLRGFLEAQGVTIIDDEDEGHIDGVTRSLEVEPISAHPHPDSERKRRVSFDDARLEETWLSERSRFAEDLSGGTPHDYLKRPPRRAGNAGPNGRARSASSSEQHFGGPRPAPKHFQEASQSSDYTSDNEDGRDPTLYMQLSQTQLEQNAEAFRDTTLVRYQRQCLHILYSVAIERQRDHAVATAHNNIQYLRPPFEVLYDTFSARREERDHHARLEQNLAIHQRRKNMKELQRAFSQWYESVLYNRKTTQLGQGTILANKYFRKWRDIATENILKSQSILTRKFLRIWQLQAAKKCLDDEMRIAHYEELLMRKYLRKWRLICRSRRAEPVHEITVERKTLATWLNRFQTLRMHENQADQFRFRRLARNALQQLSATSQVRQQAAQVARDHGNRKAASRSLQTLHVEAKLKPLAVALSSKLQFNLRRKTIRVWHLHLELSRQAADVDRKRILQSAWTNWNDALRCKALGQRIDERVVLESLSRWVLETRLRSFQRARDNRLLQRTLTTWQARSQQQGIALAQASASFADGQRQRRLKYGMLKLNIAVRHREDATRSAVEFSNSRALPDVVDVWRQRTDHVRQITAWAKDARFYYLCTKSLKVWQERTTEQQHNRRRQAYAQVRARVKIRIVRDCFARLRSKLVEVSSMQQDAQRGSEARLFRVGIESFDTWRRKTHQRNELELQARSVDHQKLLTSALVALVNQHADTAALQQQALLLRQESDLTLLASALKKVQWATFTANRRVESADALSARNRDLHLKQMLRHWAQQAGRQRSNRTKAQQDPESPSLRPASRLASRSTERPAFTSSPPVQSTTPGYLRTPSRSRRAGRFRPLPTPAHVTPMAFDNSYFITTPAPLANAEPGQDAEDAGDKRDVFVGLTPQITPFARKLRAGGITPAPPSALRSSVFGRSLAAGGTSKSVRFAGSSRFGSGRRRLNATTDE